MKGALQQAFQRSQPKPDPERCQCGHHFAQHAKRVVEEIRPCLAHGCHCQTFRRGPQ